MQSEKEYLSTKEAGRFLGFSYKTLEAWRAGGNGPKYLQLENRHIRYDRRKLEEWLHINSGQDAA
jgi:predicted DNA-binding transcriptional regulator AlpA